MGEWEGDRLICVGDYACGVPKCMELSDEEKDDLKECEDNLYTLAVEYGYSRYSSIKWAWELPWHYELGLGRRLSRGERRLIEELLKPPTTEHLVLRNLSTHEYVRGDAVVTFNDERSVKQTFNGIPRHHPKAQTLADVLVPLVYWSPEEYQGPWAGCRFDITHIDILNSGKEGDGKESWKDFTVEAMKEFRSAYAYHHGE
jgi:hypothetical protein